MESREANTNMVEETTDDNFTEDKKPWLSKDNGTLASAAVKLMLSVVVSSVVSTIAFILKNERSYSSDIIGYIYVAVVLVWVALMCLVFFRFMWSGVLKSKPQHIKSGFAIAMAVNLLVVFSAAIYASATYRADTLLYIMLFIGVFNSMVMLMFHESKMQKEEVKRQKIYYTHKIYAAPKSIQVSSVEEGNLTSIKA